MLENTHDGMSGIDHDSHKKRTHQNSVPKPKVKERDLYNGLELLEMRVKKIPTIVDPIIPKVPLIALIGTSDLGKSTLLLQLCENIALDDKFLGFPLNVKYKSAIYVSTEDDYQAISMRLQRLWEQDENKREKIENLRLLFSTVDLESRLDQELTKKKADLVVVDTFSDVFTGEMNKINQVRTYMSKYFELALKHDCTVVFNHHTTKAAEEKPPSKMNSIGSSGFEGKVRLVMELRPDYDDVNKRHLCIVKANYLPSDYKTSSYELDFSLENGFTYTGNSKDFSQLVKPPAPRGSDNDVIKGMAIELREQGNSIRRVHKLLSEKGYKVSISTVGEWVKNVSVRKNTKEDLDTGQEDDNTDENDT